MVTFDTDPLVALLGALHESLELQRFESEPKRARISLPPAPSEGTSAWGSDGPGSSGWVIAHLRRSLDEALHRVGELRAVERRCVLLDAAMEEVGLPLAVVSFDGRVLYRTRSFAAMVADWFDGRGTATTLPLALVELVEKSLVSRGAVGEERVQVGPRGELFGKLTAADTGDHWILRLREKSTTMELPRSWIERLTSREIEVVQRVVLGWDNRLVATDLGCAEATVKKHLQHVFDKLGLASSKALIHAAHEGLRSEPEAAPISGVRSVDGARMTGTVSDISRTKSGARGRPTKLARHAA